VVRLFFTLRRAFERLLEIIVMLLMVSMALVVVLAVIYRKAGASLVWYDEIASIMLAWLTYYGAALAALKRAHLGFSGLVDALRPPLRLLLVAIAELFVFTFFILLAWVGYEVLLVLEGDNLVSLPEISTQYTQSVIPIGAALFVIAEALSLPDLWQRTLRRPSVRAHYSTREATDE
jgi:TRAP-type C4-dicarboxylate transport system permease small subunit